METTVVVAHSRTARKRLKILLLGAVVLLAGAAATVLVWKPWAQDAHYFDFSGEAEAVSTTKTRTLDGLWDPKRYSDEFYYPIGIAVLDDGRLIVADSMCDRIQIIGDERTTRIGKPGQYGLSYFDSGALVDGYRENALLRKPSDVAVAPNGDIIICDTGNHVIRRMDDEFVITVAGNGVSGYQDGKEAQSRFNEPRSVALGHDGIIYVADTMNHCIRRIDPDGNVTLFAGVPEASGYRDGTLFEAQFHEPSGIAVLPSGDIIVADSGNHSIRLISNRDVSTVAGAPGELDRASGYPQGGYIDGANASARFNFPRGIAIMPDGSILVADSLNHAVRLIDGETTRTLVGNGIAGMFYGSAENMSLTRPEGVATDGETLYVSDTVNNRVVAVPLGERIMEGRPSRDAMLMSTGISLDSRYSYNGDIRVFLGDQRVDMGRVPPWNTPESVYVPIRPLFEALGAAVTLDERSNVLSVTILDQDTLLQLDRDYFILRGVAVTTIDEIARLFPYILEWFPEFSMIALHIPSDLRR